MLVRSMDGTTRAVKGSVTALDTAASTCDRSRASGCLPGGELAVAPAGGVGEAEPADEGREGGQVDENPAWQAATANATAMIFPTPVGRGARCWTAEELQGGQVADLAGVEVGPERVVGLLGVLWCGSPDSLSSLRNRRTSPSPSSSFEEEVDEVQVAHLGGFGAFDQPTDHCGVGAEV